MVIGTKDRAIGENKLGCFNQYGRCIVAPTDIIKETLGNNQCTVFLYKLPDGYFFGYDISVGDIVRSRRPLESDALSKSKLEAKLAAKKAVLAEICVSRKAKRLFAKFSIILELEQSELFDTDYLNELAKPGAGQVSILQDGL